MRTWGIVLGIGLALCAAGLIFGLTSPETKQEDPISAPETHLAAASKAIFDSAPVDPDQPVVVRINPEEPETVEETAEPERIAQEEPVPEETDGFSIQGEVLNQDDWKPLPGVQIFAVTWDNFLRSPQSILNNAADAIGISDGNGHFELRGLRGETTYGLMTIHDEYVQTEPAVRRTINPSEPSEEVLLTMTKGGTVSGAVRFSGENLVQHEVTLTYENGNRDREMVRTDANGMYRFNGLRPGPVIVRAEVALTAGLPSDAAVPARVAGGEETVADLIWDGWDAGIFGRIMPFDPKKDYDIVATHYGDTEKQEVYTAEVEADGSFLIANMPYGRFSVVVDASRYNRNHERSRALVKTMPGELSAHDFYFSQDSVAQGYVANLNPDEPLTVLASKTLRLDNPSPRTLELLHTLDSTYYAHVDESGGFYFEGLDPGTYLIIAEGGEHRYGMATIHVSAKSSRSVRNIRPSAGVEILLTES